jgi:hypothetical protein
MFKQQKKKLRRGAKNNLEELAKRREVQDEEFVIEARKRKDVVEFLRERGRKPVEDEDHSESHSEMIEPSDLSGKVQSKDVVTEK